MSQYKGRRKGGRKSTKNMGPVLLLKAIGGVGRGCIKVAIEGVEAIEKNERKKEKGK